MNLLLIPIVLPLASALLVLLLPEKTKYLKELLTSGVTAVCLLAGVSTLFSALFGQTITLDLPWAGAGLNFTLKADNLSSFLLLSVSFFSFLISIYAFSFENKGGAKWFFFNLLMTQAFAAGAVLSDNLLALLFFWEGLLVFLYTFIALSQKTEAAKRTAKKAFLINAVTDLCLLVGVTIVACISGSMNMTVIASAKLTMNGWAGFAYVLMMIGAVSKAGAFPFHTWIPDAATDSSAPFMAYVPAAVDKLLGIYFLARISVYLFSLNGAMQLVLMTLGAVTILAAVMMAFVQTDYKRLLSYHAVSQAGYMILGIGTLNPIGIAGGLFHMLNNAVYKSCLFMTAGAVEKRTGTNDLSKLGGLFRAMPVTGICFVIAAAAISGIAPLNGFFSKEMIYKGTLSTGYTVFFWAAEVGSFLTLASFLKLGHAAFFGKRAGDLTEVREAPFSNLLPMAILAALCIAFGFGAALPINWLIRPAMYTLNLHTPVLSGFHPDELYWLSLIVILAAVINHIVGYTLSGGRAWKASDHIHNAPLLAGTYALAEKRFFDPYEQAMRAVPFVAAAIYKIDRFFDYLTDALPSSLGGMFSGASSRLHNGSYPLYMALTIAGALVYIFITANYGGIR
ncbi:MAG: proton-conducting transporter membrane subunit [Elusimicrobia bacterium]|nr:proton-conducting transporter membrane subunit [Elusimicrobiota bacterium]